ncbi:MAG: hypothetical protein H6936_08440 [Burkholderiales bacterium]|nr:hypothetical protein [Nitrosomonas sp.]MCP5274859.1 hypothetical protein [Burkholderiales bacterium]
MCGYCTEGLVLEYLLSGVRRNHHRSIYLQEADFLRDIETHGCCATQHQLDIVLCRVLDHHINWGHDASIIDRLLAAGADIVGPLGSRRGHALWPIVDETIYHDKDRWNTIIADPGVLHTALRTLDHYHDWWIGGNGRTDSLDQGANDGDIGSNDGASDWQTFCNIFPIVSFSLSLSLVSKNHGDADVVKKIALGPPHSVPDMVANDLWLQRRAIMTCVDRYGPRFIADNLPRLRYELVSYVLLRSDFGSLELNRVKEAVLAEESHEISILMEATDVVELIDRLDQPA